MPHTHVRRPNNHAAESFDAFQEGGFVTSTRGRADMPQGAIKFNAANPVSASGEVCPPIVHSLSERPLGSTVVQAAEP